MRQRASARGPRDVEDTAPDARFDHAVQNLFPLKDRNPTTSSSRSARFSTPPGVEVTPMFPSVAKLRLRPPALVAQWREHAPPKRGMQVRLLPGASLRKGEGPAALATGPSGPASFV